MTDRGEGYCPHAGMRYFRCPRCGAEQFRSYPQSVPLNFEVWTFEFVCAECGQVIGLTENRRKKE